MVWQCNHESGVLYSEAQIKNAWRELCKQHHPDVGGDLATMQAINKVAEIIRLEGLVVELCGRWVWITGETYRWKTQLKAAAFRWAAKKAAWYWHKEGDAPGRHKAWNLEQIKNKYGATRLNDRHSQGSFSLCG